MPQLMFVNGHVALAYALRVILTLLVGLARLTLLLYATQVILIVGIFSPEGKSRRKIDHYNLVSSYLEFANPYLQQTKFPGLRKMMI